MTEETQQDARAQEEQRDEHRWLRRLVGEWTYEGRASMGPGMPEQTMRGNASTRPFGGLWIMVEDRTAPQTSDGRTSIITLGYDARKGRFVGTFLDSGSTYMWHYDGWLERNRLTLEAEGPAMDGSGMATYQDIVEIVDDNYWILRSQLPGENGGWQEFMASHYRRA